MLAKAPWKTSDRTASLPLTETGRTPRGSATMVISKLRARYEAIPKPFRFRDPRVPSRPRTLFEATGDPLALTEPDLAARTYGLNRATRPSVALLKLHEAIFKNSMIPGLSLSLWLIERRGLTARRAAQEAVVLAAERGAFQRRAPTAAEEERLRWPIIKDEKKLKSVLQAGGYGGGAIVAPFDTAVQRLQEAIIAHGRQAPGAPDGDTGRTLFIRIPAMAVLRDPRSLERMPPGDHEVADNLFWRRRLADGDVAEIDP